jgi:hypothetical protein
MLLGDALPPAAATDDDGQRRNALAQRLDALERLLERLNRRHRASPPAAGDGSPA